MAYYPSTVTIPVYAVFTAIAIGLTTLRFWARRQHLRTTLGIDDWLMVLGTFIVTACACIQFYNAIDGTGGAAVSPEDAESRAITAHRINFVMIVIEKPAFGAIKLSLCFFYKRIFDVWDSFRRANNFVIWIIILWTLSFALADILICGDELHFNFDADQTLGAKYCGDKGMLLLMFAVTSVITDLLVLALPFLYVRRLQMPKQKRWATIFVFCLGAASTIAGVLRTIFLSVAYTMGRMDWDYEAPPHQETPYILQIFNPTFWVMIEMCLGAWAANLPPLGPLLKTLTLMGVLGSVRERFSEYGSKSKTRRDTRQRTINVISGQNTTKGRSSSGGGTVSVFAASEADEMPMIALAHLPGRNDSPRRGRIS